MERMDIVYGIVSLVVGGVVAAVVTYGFGLKVYTGIIAGLCAAVLTLLAGLGALTSPKTEEKKPQEDDEAEEDDEDEDSLHDDYDDSHHDAG